MHRCDRCLVYFAVEEIIKNSMYVTHLNVKSRKDGKKIGKMHFYVCIPSGKSIQTNKWNKLKALFCLFNDSNFSETQIPF